MKWNGKNKEIGAKGCSHSKKGYLENNEEQAEVELGLIQDEAVRLYFGFVRWPLEKNKILSLYN